jgi:hypothetical protein
VLCLASPCIARGRQPWVTTQRFRGADSGSVLASHRLPRHTPRHAQRETPRHASGYRRGPNRLTLAVAAATVASASVAASAAVGFSLSAATGPAPASHAAGSADRLPMGVTSPSGAERRAGSGGPDSADAVAGGSASPTPGSGKAASGKAAAGKSSDRKAPAPGAQRTANGHKAVGKPKAKPYLIYDSVIPQAIPAGQVVATYATGAHPIPASAVAGRRRVIWIDTLGTDPSANELDIEPGCASPSQAAGWVRARLTTHPGATAILYSSISEWSEIRADVASLPAWMRARIRWWIADPTGSPHMVPGAQATQWYWGSNYDISTALPGLT